jgi:hypothetical protein
MANGARFGIQESRLRFNRDPKRIRILHKLKTQIQHHGLLNVDLQVLNPYRSEAGQLGLQPIKARQELCGKVNGFFPNNALKAEPVSSLVTVTVTPANG